MNTAKIALRNLSRQKRRSFFLAGAIAFGVFIVTMVNAFSAGAVRILKENFAEMIGGHVYVTLEHREGDKTVRVIEDDGPIMAALGRLGIKDSQVSRTVDAQQTLIVYGSKSTIMGVVGVDWNDSKGLADKLGLPSEVLAKLRAGQEGIVFSKKSAEKLKVEAGETVLVRAETVTGQQNLGEVFVAWITSDTSDTGAFVCFASKSFVNTLLNLSNAKAYSTLRVRLASLDQTEAFAKSLEEALKASYAIAPKASAMPGMESNVFRMSDGTGKFEGVRAKVTTINQFLTQITSLSVGLQIASFIMLVVLLLITMIGIANTFRMIMYERIREIGTMRAVGMLRKHVRSLFLMEALFLAQLGVAAGIVFGGLVSVVLSFINFGTESFFSLFLQNGHLNFLIRFVDVAVIVVLVSAFTLLAARGPARKAAKLHPADALRTSL